MLQNLDRSQPYFLSLLRAISALVLFSYGTQKILHFPAAQSVPPVGSMSWIAGMLELVLGFCVLIGFKTRYAAFVLSGLMAFAYFIGHFPRGIYPAQNGGVAAILFCFIFLYIFAAGPGPVSVDAKMQSK
ncbi:DoxX family protein [Aliirhizobium cellulosilyticum]|uniref:Putative oxidoreductase n=1 Tax=Aliirhizobium cellulosilyticum TaxID=393664 RepID=A0A7W6TCE5_9HYPH|nr:DoxX family protein [Rhizobium cellulosilyticum]MBB4346649.1 putative oxidoreductase [Rhizobium cellulosilyticum]MBB4410957.1 putative oxidoreductase [Rhizobium cellulosilyticum]MBB4445645.1 putative oxidoreductase [Rhizobium cellulosilyticum]